MPRTLKIFGPPGTGKTTELLNLLDFELSNGVPPSRIAFLTFTVAARKVAVERVNARFTVDKDDLKYFKTLHSVAFSQVGASRDGMMTSRALRELGDYVRLDFTQDSAEADEDVVHPEPGGTLGDRLLSFDHLRRHRLMTFETAFSVWADDCDYHVARYFVESYEKFKQDTYKVDFTDLLTMVKEPLDVDVVFVDEAQDLSLLQWEVLDRFAANASRMYIAGDDDQAIFTWAGASPEAFVRRKGAIRVLHDSHRVPRNIFPLAQDLTSMLSFRQEKAWRPHAKEAGSLDFLPDVEHWEVPPDGDVLALVRNHFIAQDIERRLRELGEPYKRHDGRRAGGLQWGPAISAWEDLRRSESIPAKKAQLALEAMMLDDVGTASLKRMSVRAEDVTMRELQERYDMPAELTQLPWYDALDRIPQAEVTYLRNIIARYGGKGVLGDPRITVSTVHAAKGAEADHVLLMTQLGRRSKDALWTNDSDDEVRVAYVAATRAKKTLTVVGDDNPLFNRHLFTGSTIYTGA